MTPNIWKVYSEKQAVASKSLVKHSCFILKLMRMFNVILDLFVEVNMLSYSTNKYEPQEDMPHCHTILCLQDQTNLKASITRFYLRKSIPFSGKTALGLHPGTRTSWQPQEFRGGALEGSEVHVRRVVLAGGRSLQE